LGELFGSADVLAISLTESCELLAVSRPLFSRLFRCSRT
jgi:hypothetical protein